MTIEYKQPIALFIPSLNGGGAQKVVVNLANALVELTGRPIHVVLVKKSGQFLTELREEVEIIDLKSSRTLFSIGPLVRYLKTVRPIAIMSSMNYVNIICATSFVFSGKSCRLVLREANVLTVSNRSALELITVHGIILLMRFFYKYSNALVLNSKGTLDSLDQYGIIPRDVEKHIVHNPITLQQEKEGDSFSPPFRYICAIGRLVYQKGFDILINALVDIADKSMHLVILGEGPLLSKLVAQANDRGVSSRVHFLGFVSPVSNVLKGAEAFVLSSRWEGFGNVIVEALALGIPVVSTDCNGGPKEILENGKHGLLVNSLDVNALTEGINETLRNAKGTVESRKLRALDFAPEVIGRRYLEILVPSPPSPP